jgi:hypothetical protein
VRKVLRTGNFLRAGGLELSYQQPSQNACHRIHHAQVMRLKPHQGHKTRRCLDDSKLALALQVDARVLAWQENSKCRILNDHSSIPTSQGRSCLSLTRTNDSNIMAGIRKTIQLGSLRSSLSSELPPLYTGRSRAATNAHSQGVQSTDFVFQPIRIIQVLFCL